LRTDSRARPDTGPDFISETTRRSDYGKKLYLIGENHRHVLGTIAELKEIIDPTNGILRPSASLHRTKAVENPRCRTMREVNIGSGLPA
jgi:hypothetical protein